MRFLPSALLTGDQQILLMERLEHHDPSITSNGSLVREKDGDDDEGDEDDCHSEASEASESSIEDAAKEQKALDWLLPDQTFHLQGHGHGHGLDYHDDKYSEKDSDCDEYYQQALSADDDEEDEDDSYDDDSLGTESDLEMLESWVHNERKGPPPESSRGNSNRTSNIVQYDAMPRKRRSTAENDIQDRRCRNGNSNTNTNMDANKPKDAASTSEQIMSRLHAVNNVMGELRRRHGA